MKPENAGTEERRINLEVVRIGTPFEIEDAMGIAARIVDPDGEGVNNHWQKVSFSLLTGIILHVLYAEPDKTLRGVAVCLNDPEIFGKMVRVEHPVTTQVAKEILNRSEPERSATIATANYFLARVDGDMK